MATIKDVARLAGVSAATVSRVINGGCVVLDETKERVKKAIAELNYSPNLLGRNLRRLETKKILVILNTVSNQFYSRVVKGIEECARAGGYTVMLCMTHGEAALEADYLGLLRSRLVDGAVMLTSEASGEELKTSLCGMPVVQACEPTPDFDAPSVSIDNEKAAYEAVSYLISKGHTKIAYLGASGVYPSSILRENGYRRAMSEHSLQLNEKWIFSEGFSFNSGMRAAKRLIALKELPSALFCVSDSCAAGAIKTLAQIGISTPCDISVMGFDDTLLSQVYIPSITTTRQPQYQLGFTAMSLLLKLIAGTPITCNGDCCCDRHIILPHEIVERESVEAAKL